MDIYVIQNIETYFDYDTRLILRRVNKMFKTAVKINVKHFDVVAKTIVDRGTTLTGIKRLFNQESKCQFDVKGMFTIRDMVSEITIGNERSYPCHHCGKQITQKITENKTKTCSKCSKYECIWNAMEPRKIRQKCLLIPMSFWFVRKDDELKK